MRQLSPDKRAMILKALVEGMGVSAAARMFGVSKVTVLRLLADAGAFCADYHDLTVRRLLSARVEADRIWSFCGCKASTKARGGQGHGEVWTWTAIDSDTKLCISFLVADRSREAARAFMRDLASRVSSRIQLTTDAHATFQQAVYEAFADVDYAVLSKQAAPGRRGAAAPRAATTKRCIEGAPDLQTATTAFVERSNLTLRMASRRFTRLTNGFSKRLENHAHAVALHFWHYNFARVHSTLKTTPAVAAALASRPYSMGQLALMIGEEERRLGGRLTDYLPATGRPDSASRVRSGAPAGRAGRVNH